jgi:hypothetical protein
MAAKSKGIKKQKYLNLFSAKYDSSKRVKILMQDLGAKGDSRISKPITLVKTRKIKILTLAKD